MELIHLKSLTDEGRAIVFAKSKKTLLREMVKSNTFFQIKKMFYQKFARNLLLHFKDKKNKERFCLFSGIKNTDLPETELVQYFFQMALKSVFYILKTDPVILTKDKTLSFYATYFHCIYVADSDFKSENHKSDMWYSVKDKNGQYSLHTFVSSGFDSKFHNAITHSNQTYSSNIIFFKDIVSLLLSWSKESDAKFKTSLIQTKLKEKTEKNTNDFYYRINFYMKKLKTNPEFIIEKTENIKRIDKILYKTKTVEGSNENIQLKSKRNKKHVSALIQPLKEDIEYLAYYFAATSKLNEDGFERFVNMISCFSANKKIPNIHILEELHGHLTSSEKTPFYRSSNAIFDPFEDASFFTKKIIWFLNEFNVYPTTEEITTQRQKIFQPSEGYLKKVRKLAPMKIPFELKKLIIDAHFIADHIVSSSGYYGFKELSLKISDDLLYLYKSGISAKTLTGFFAKFFNIELYCNSQQCLNKSFSMLNFSNIHNIYSSLSNFRDNYIWMFNKKLSENHLSVIRKIFKIANSYNTDSNSLNHLENLFRLTFGNSNPENILDYLSSKKITSLRDINETISDYMSFLEQEQINKIILTGLISENDKRITFAKREFKLKNAVLFFDKLSKNQTLLQKFETKTDFILNEYEYLDYKIGIYDHHHYAGFSGALANGVCIDSYGEHRQDQLNKNFLNLVVYNDDKGIMLWGLLVLAVDVFGKNWFVLNNLQGGINDKKIDSRIVMDLIIKSFQKLCNDNKNLDGFIINDTTFNSLRFSEFLNITINQESNDEFFENHKIKILQAARLDFSFNKELVINQYSHYNTLFPLKF